MYFATIIVYMVVFLFNTVVDVFLLLRLLLYVYVLIVCLYLILCLCIFTVPAGTIRLFSLSFFRAFSSVVRQMPG